ALSATWLLVALIGCRMLVRSKFGRVLTAIRDAEDRVRFCGYDPVGFKLFVWTLSAAICGVAGALYVPQVGIINPSEMSPANSVEIAIWVAVGGRGTLLGPILGAALINGAKSWLTVRRPSCGSTPWGSSSSWSRAGFRTACSASSGGSRSEPRYPAGTDPLSRRRDRELRRLQGAGQLEPDRRAGRVALHHRPQRRRQDHHDGRDHGQDPPRGRRGALRQRPRPHAHVGAGDRAGGDRAQVPEADHLQEPHGVRE